MAIQLVCLPFAGAGAGLFRAWRQQAAPDVDIVGVQLPGRERRIADEPYTDVHQAMDGVLPEVLTALEDELQPVVTFGHSLGALLAFELTRRLLTAGRKVSALIVSGAAGPLIPRQVQTQGLDDDALVAKVEAITGYRHPALEHPELRAMVLPTLRTDLAMNETYVPQSHERIPVPIFALRGADDILVSAADSARWADVAGAGLTEVTTTGGHMYLTDDHSEILRVARSIQVAAVTP